MTIRAIIWDLGGVILRTEDQAPRSQLAKQMGMTYEDLDRLVFESQSSKLATVGKIDEASHWENVFKVLDLPVEGIPSFQASFFGGDRIDARLVDAIDSLRPRFRTGLLSNAWSGLRQYVENDWHIAHAFDDIIVSAEVGLAKPDPHIYQLAIDRLGVTGAEAVFIDDVNKNVEGARTVGLDSIQFLSPSQVQAELRKLLGPQWTSN
jgi:epoxide hydrolase-like predicted phosphatase